MARRPPSAERVLQQEANHVVLSEQLGDGREVSTANLDPRFVDPLLLGGLPELIDPPECILRLEHLGGDAEEGAFQLDSVLGGEADLNGRVM